MIRKTGFIVGVLLSCFFLVQGQTGLSTKNKKAIALYVEADNYRVRRQYTQAISMLQEALEKDKNFVEAYYRLGLVYFSLKNFPEAVRWMEMGLSKTNEIRKQKVFWFDLGEGYMALGRYESAIDVLEKFLKAEVVSQPRIAQAQHALENARFSLAHKDEEGKYKSHSLGSVVNCFPLQYFPVLTADQSLLIYTRRLGNGTNDDEDLVVSRKDAKGFWQPPVSLSPKINSKFNEGTCTISADGRKLIFTSCVGRPGFGSCDLFESQRIGDAWSTPSNLGAMVNSPDWESQPSLSADGQVLYFVSDRRGGFGRRDIWVSYLSEDGKWTKAVNLGKEVNTEYDEISPFIHVNNKTLYFSSKGITGFGGYDIFFSEKTGENQWTPPVNVGYPVNNHEDQFSLFITADGKTGYYSHEEPTEEGQSVSKIFQVEIPEDQVRYKSNYVKGIVRDKVTRQPLSATVELFNLEKNQRESKVDSDSITGEYLMVLTQGADYALYVNKRKYLFQSLNFNYTELKDFEPVVMDIDLDPVREGSVAVLKNIFFDVDKYELKEKSQTELEKLIRFMKENAAVKIEIGGHTDNTGSAGYNRQLSEKRARAVFDYLVEKGIDARRLTPKGYGPDQPRASNDGEEGRQLNRRIEFKVK